VIIYLEQLNFEVFLCSPDGQAEKAKVHSPGFNFPSQVHSITMGQAEA
jgi:hypothetical protein